DLGGGDSEQLAHIPQPPTGYLPLDGLREVEQRHDRGALPTGRIAGDDRARLIHDCALEDGHQRSTPPNTGSIEAMAAMVSAISDPSTMFGVACRFTNEGSRILTL